MNFPALDLVALATRIKGAGGANPLGYSGGSVITLVFGPSPAVAGVEFGTDGQVMETPSSTSSYGGDPIWISGTFDPADFEIKAEMVSGTTTPAGNIPFGSFASLSVIRSLELIRSSIGEDIAVFDITIREIATPSNTTTGQVTLFVNFNA